MKESSAAHEHFIDLCHLLGEPTPAEDDPAGERYCFERGAKKDTGGDGWADVWKKHCFAWEYKGKHRDLNKAFEQLRQYSLALDNPPLLIVSDMETIRITTNWTNSVSVTETLVLEDLADAAARQRLKWAMSEPERLRPGQTRHALTESVAETFASLAQALRDRGHDSHEVAKFLNRLVFCMFAEDVDLLPRNLFTRMLHAARQAPSEFVPMARELFASMAGGDRYVERMFSVYADRVPQEADLVCYWFHKAGQLMAKGRTIRAGLVATNSIRGGANRRLVEGVLRENPAKRIFDAWSDEPWVLDGAAVRVLLICFSPRHDESGVGARLDGESAEEI